jgi:hypothetical protein
MACSLSESFLQILCCLDCVTENLYGDKHSSVVNEKELEKGERERERVSMRERERERERERVTECVKERN